MRRTTKQSDQAKGRVLEPAELSRVQGGMAGSHTGGGIASSVTTPPPPAPAS